MSSTTIILLVIPFVLNLGLISWAITDLLPRENVKYLSKTGWIIVIGLVFFGSLIYMFVGRDNQRDLTQSKNR